MRLCLAKTRGRCSCARALPPEEAARAAIRRWATASAAAGAHPRRPRGPPRLRAQHAHDDAGQPPATRSARCSPERESAASSGSSVGRVDRPCGRSRPAARSAGAGALDALRLEGRGEPLVTLPDVPDCAVRHVEVGAVCSKSAERQARSGLRSGRRAQSGTGTRRLEPDRLRPSACASTSRSQGKYPVALTVTWCTPTGSATPCAATRSSGPTTSSSMMTVASAGVPAHAQRDRGRGRRPSGGRQADEAPATRPSEGREPRSTRPTARVHAGAALTPTRSSPAACWRCRDDAVDAAHLVDDAVRDPRRAPRTGSFAQSAVIPSTECTARTAQASSYVRSSPMTPTLLTGRSTANACQISS